jgi:hypothetical protein
LILLSFLDTLAMVNFLRGFTTYLSIRAEVGASARIIPSVFF